MTQISRPQGGLRVTYPDSGAYTAVEWAERIRPFHSGDFHEEAVHSADLEDSGVVPTNANFLNVTDDGVDIAIDTGVACVHGHVLFNDASLTISPTHPGAGDTYTVVAVQNDTAVAYNTNLDCPAPYAAGVPAYSTRLAILQDTALVQNANYWMIPLATFDISAAGAITNLADARLYTDTRFEVDSFDDDAITDAIHIGVHDITDSGGAAGMGVGIRAHLVNDNGDLEQAGQLALVWTDATDGGEDSRFEMRLSAGNADNLSGVVEAPTTASVDGNARGESAVDWQGDRSAAAQVASGDYATLSGGHDGTASGDYATVGGGSNNTASGDYSTVGGGQSTNTNGDYATASGGSGNNASATMSTVAGGDSNTASDLYAAVGGGGDNLASADYTTVSGGYDNEAAGDYSTVGGGSTNDNDLTASYGTIGGGRDNNCLGESTTVSGGRGNYAMDNYAAVGGGRGNSASADYATIAGGYDNTASGDYASVPGGLYGLADLYGQVAHASGQFAAAGDAQGTIQMVARCTTAGGGAATELFLDGAGGAERMVIPADSAWTYHILIVAMRQNAAAVHSSTASGVIYRDNANNTTLASAAGVVVEQAGGGTAAVAADDPNDSLKITFTDDGANVYRAVATIRLAQVTYP